MEHLIKQKYLSIYLLTLGSTLLKKYNSLTKLFRLWNNLLFSYVNNTLYKYDRKHCINNLRYSRLIFFVVFSRFEYHFSTG